MELVAKSHSRIDLILYEMKSRNIIFPASRKIGLDEEREIILKTVKFLDLWSAHGMLLESQISIAYQQFIIISVDEEVVPASGCSLDVLNRFMREVDQKYHLGLFDRMKVCYVENQQIKTMKLQNFRIALENKSFSTDIQIFDFSKPNEEGFLLPLCKSWARRKKI